MLCVAVCLFVCCVSGGGGVFSLVLLCFLSFCVACLARKFVYIFLLFIFVVVFLFLFSSWLAFFFFSIWWFDFMACFGLFVCFGCLLIHYFFI